MPTKTKLTNFDVAEHLQTNEDRAEYIKAWLEEAPYDIEGIARAYGDVARSIGMSQVAKDAGLTRASLYKSLSSGGKPSFDTVLRVTRAMGLRFEVKVAPKKPTGKSKPPRATPAHRR